MCDAEGRLWDCEHELAAVAKKYEALGGDRAYAELGEPAGLRARLVVLALERACQERERAP